MGIASRTAGTNKMKLFGEYNKVLLWSNNSTNGFPSQTVTFSGADYGVYYVEGSQYTTGTGIAHGEYVIAEQETILRSDRFTEQRRVTISKGRAWFSYGGGGNTWNNSTVYCPRRIYGLKGLER